MAVLVFLALLALSLLLPARIPGELSGSAMSQHEQPLCEACPRAQRLTALGVVASEDAWHVNIQFAAPPFNNSLQLQLQGLPDAIDLEQTGTTWRTPSGAGSTSVKSITQHGDRVVVELPASLRTNGFAASTASGDRMPASGFVTPLYPGSAHFNATDVVLLLILLAGAWYGYKRGLLPETADLIAVALALAIAAVVAKPLSAAFASMTSTPAAAADLASGAVVVVTGILGFLFVPKIADRFRDAARGFPPLVGRGGGAAFAVVRQLIVLAMILSVGVQLRVFNWAAASITSSAIGSALLNAWRTLYS